MADGCIDETAKGQLAREYESTNPAELLRRIRILLRQLEELPAERAEPGAV
jgi:hypothetical protein